MRLIRVRVALAGALVAIAGTTAGVVLAAGPASAESSQVVLVNCSELVTGLTWTSWRPVAFGSGVLKVNDCTPSCAQGKYISYPILTVLWRARQADGRHAVLGLADDFDAALDV